MGLRTSLMNLDGKADKKEKLEQILQQYDMVKDSSKKLCDMLSDVAGVNVHEVQMMGIQKESTLHLVLRLRGGMCQETSGRNDYEPVTSDDLELQHRQQEAVELKMLEERVIQAARD